MHATVQRVVEEELAKRDARPLETSITSYTETLDLARTRRWRQRPASAFVPSNAQRCVIEDKPATARGVLRSEGKPVRVDPREELSKEVAELRRSVYEEQARAKMLRERRDELLGQREQERGGRAVTE
eukprot:766302-Hanusia_phi.AAC.2